MASVLCSSSSFFDIEPLDGGGSSLSGHAMDACSLSGCGKRLSWNCDVYMYRGNKPFCSEECRHRQMEMDEAEALRISTTANAREHAATNEQRHRLELGNAAVAANVPVLS